MIKASIIGATGYAGIELVRLLQQHPGVTLSHVCTESHAGKELTEVFPHLQGAINLQGKKLQIDAIIQDSDLIFIALPHGHAIEIVPQLLAAGKKAIDLGADFRLQNPVDYQNWYQHPPAATTLLKQAVYGLPEAGKRNAIQKAALIANPGCYPTATLLATLPALKAGIIDPQQCIFDAKSGVSGAGRSLALQSHYCEIAENITPYQIGGKHRHTPEIEQELSLMAGSPLIIQFTPHLMPIVRGLTVTAYFKLTQKITLEEIHTLYEKAYPQEPFIRIFPLNEVPQIKHVRGTNYCDIGVFLDARTQRLIVVSAIDNLVKGASGQAVQNMNLMYQLPETTGLNNIGIYP